MSRTPEISVIVPVYNTAPWLRRCLDSICTQSYRELEIICVNDGSTDDSAEILQEYASKDSRIKVIHQKNAGLSAARNAALEQASGEWVTGVDSDDYLASFVYERAMDRAAPEVDMVFFGATDVDDDGRALPHNAYFDLPEAGVYPMSPDLAEKLNVCFCTKLWRRSVIEKHALRFPEGLLHEDTALYYLAVPFVRKVAVYDAMGYMYVQRSGSIMHMAHDTQLAMASRYAKVASFLLGRYREMDLLRGAARHYLVNMQAHLCRWFRYMKNPDEQMAAEALLRDMVRESGLWRENYCMERLIPVEWWKKPFLSRHEQAKVWRFLYLPLYIQRFDEKGLMTGGEMIAWSKLRRLFSGA